MDPFSQATVGALVAHGAGGRRLGLRALALGAGAGALPDVDVLFSAWGDYFDALASHRGITHSLFFAPLVGPPLGWLIWRVERSWDRQRLKRWMLVMALALFSHPLLDLMTPYGTQLLAPLSNARFAIDAMPIIDPLYTLVLVAGVLACCLRPAHRLPPLLALALSTGYIAYAHSLNEGAAELARKQLAQSGVANAQVVAYPTMLQIHLRRVVARSPDMVRSGFVSMWKPCPIEWGTAPVLEDQAVAAWRSTREGRIFEWFAMGWVLHWRDAAKLISADLRYGFVTDPRVSVFTTVGEFDAGRLVRVRGARSTPGPEQLSPSRLFAQAFPRACQAVKYASTVQHTEASAAATEA